MQIALSIENSTSSSATGKESMQTSSPDAYNLHKLK